MTETLKFFEEKNTESIINWMLSNLSEEQIRSCLQTSTPDTSVITEPSAPQEVSAAAAGVIPSTVTLPDGTVKQLQPGEGSSTDPLPSKKITAERRFLEKYRNKCKGMAYLIKSVNASGVVYYEFKEVESEDSKLNSWARVGTTQWTLQNKKLSEFKSECNPGDEEILDMLKEENQESFNNLTDDMKEIIKDYIQNGNIPPIQLPVDQGNIDVSEPADQASQSSTPEEVQITEPMLKALKIQQASSSVLQTEYPNLYSKGLTMYPIFVYGSNGDNVIHLSAYVDERKLKLKLDTTNKRILNSKFRKVTNSIVKAINDSIYEPSDDIQAELNESVKNESIDPSILVSISKIYDPIRLEGKVYFGTLEDEDFELVSRPSTPVTPDESSTFDMSSLSSSLISSASKSYKKVSDMTIEEIEKRMKDQFGEGYVRDYKPVKYTNSIGVTNVKYVKRNPGCDRQESFEMVQPTPFYEFQGQPSVNAGPGKFGESLLF